MISPAALAMPTLSALAFAAIGNPDQLHSRIAAECGTHGAISVILRAVIDDNDLEIGIVAFENMPTVVAMTFASL